MAWNTARQNSMWINEYVLSSLVSVSDCICFARLLFFFGCLCAKSLILSFVVGAHFDYYFGVGLQRSRAQILLSYQIHDHTQFKFNHGRVHFSPHKMRNSYKSRISPEIITTSNSTNLTKTTPNNAKSKKYGLCFYCCCCCLIHCVRGFDRSIRRKM